MTINKFLELRGSGISSKKTHTLSEPQKQTFLGVAIYNTPSLQATVGGAMITVLIRKNIIAVTGSLQSCN